MVIGFIVIDAKGALSKANTTKLIRRPLNTMDFAEKARYEVSPVSLIQRDFNHPRDTPAGPQQEE